MMLDPQVILAAARARSEYYPYAAWMPLRPEVDTQPSYRKTTFIAHSMAGPQLTTIEALHRYASRAEVTKEPTFALDMAGRCAQFLRWSQRADCNAKANTFAVSVETQDQGSPTLPVTEWTPAQVAQIAGMIAFGHLRDGIPIALPPAWDKPGAGYHRLFGYPYWSIYQGKTCPGDARVAQWPTILALAARYVELALAPTPPTPPLPEDDDDMTIAFAVAAPTTAAQYLVTLGGEISMLPFASIPDREAILDAIDQARRTSRPPMANVSGDQLALLFKLAKVSEEQPNTT